MARVSYLQLRMTLVTNALQSCFLREILATRGFTFDRKSTKDISHNYLHFSMSFVRNLL